MEGRFVFFLPPDQICSHDAIEGVVAERNGRVGARCGFY